LVFIGFSAPLGPAIATAIGQAKHQRKTNRPKFLDKWVSS
jgi:hypothetical protein